MICTELWPVRPPVPHACPEDEMTKLCEMPATQLTFDLCPFPTSSWLLVTQVTGVSDNGAAQTRRENDCWTQRALFCTLTRDTEATLALEGACQSLGFCDACCIRTAGCQGLEGRPPLVEFIL